jgi:hypothetical protein
MKASHASAVRRLCLRAPKARSRYEVTGGNIQRTSLHGCSKNCLRRVHILSVPGASTAGLLTSTMTISRDVFTALHSACQKLLLPSVRRFSFATDAAPAVLTFVSALLCLVYAGSSIANDDVPTPLRCVRRWKNQFRGTHVHSLRCYTDWLQNNRKSPNYA